MDISNEILDGLSENVRDKVSACTTADDLLALAKSEGIELSAEQMEQVAGGSSADTSWGNGSDGCGNIHFF